MIIFFILVGVTGETVVHVLSSYRYDIVISYRVKGEVSWGFWYLLSKMMKIKTINQLPNNSRMTRGKKSTQFLKGTTRDLFKRILEPNRLTLSLVRGTNRQFYCTGVITYDKLDNYFVVSADRQTFLGFEMTANLRDTSLLTWGMRFHSAFALRDTSWRPTCFKIDKFVIVTPSWIGCRKLRMCYPFQSPGGVISRRDEQSNRVYMTSEWVFVKEWKSRYGTVTGLSELVPEWKSRRFHVNTAYFFCQVFSTSIQKCLAVEILYFSPMQKLRACFCFLWPSGGEFPPP